MAKSYICLPTGLVALHKTHAHNTPGRPEQASLLFLYSMSDGEDVGPWSEIQRLLELSFGLKLGESWVNWDGWSPLLPSRLTEFQTQKGT